jgi:hypothetical protein
VAVNEEENLLSHTYHDSLLKGMEIDDSQTTLVIDTDVYWCPGKPFTLLTLVNPDRTSRIKELVGGHEHTAMSISEASVQRSDRSDKNFCLQIEFHSGEQLEVCFYNFWEERVESYKDYTNSVFR